MNRMKRKPPSDATETINAGINDNNDGSSKDPERKRPREEDPINFDGAVSRDTVATRPAPKYGSKEYWEARYKSHLPDVDLRPEKVKATGAFDNEKDCAAVEKYENTNESETYHVLDGVVLTKEATKPGHEWYFSYDELRPLILPLILGETDNEIEKEYDEDEESWVEVEEGGDNDESESDHELENGIDSGENEEISSSTQQLNSADSNSQGESEVEKCPFTGVTNQKNHRPKRVLEVGCGDMPLGTSLASDFVSMQSDTGFDCQMVMEEVTCIDYSEIVVNSLIGKQKKDPKTKLLPNFRALDARSLPFASNTYDLVIEKGTLDAMLSDEADGLDNCVQIVKEMARVTSEGGAILIVSHLNANEAKGMGWLQDVVFRGLKDEFLERHKWDRRKGKETPGETNNEREYVWSVQVHGSGNEIDEETDEDAAPDYGPAVYIIRKKGVPASVAKELFGTKENEESAEAATENATKKGIEEDGPWKMPPVKLEFLSYES